METKNISTKASKPNKEPVVTNIPVIPRYVKHELLCPDCNASMEPTGEVLCSYPAQYPHICPVCGTQIQYGITEKYPYIETIYDEIK